MTHPRKLLKRLDEIGASLEESGHALALISLGSVGVETHRLDEYSDLDFFAIVEPGYKQRYMENIDWLSRPHPISYYFANTPDGFKLLYADGIFCECAVFEPEELQAIPYSAGRIIWKRKDAPDGLESPAKALRHPVERTQEYLIGEAVTNLYVGMGRERRGERLSAMRFIQSYAVDRLLELAETIEPGQDSGRDIFSIERRFEQRHPEIAQELPLWTQGYERNAESALAILSFLERHFAVNKAMADAVRQLCDG